MGSGTRCFGVIAVVAVFLGWSGAQTESGAASAIGASTRPQSQTGTVPTFKASARLVVVDVVATDSGHNPVHGLKATDFKLTENGIPQSIQSFEEHSELSSGPANSSETPRLPAGVFTNYTPVPPNAELNILLLDALNTPLRDQMFMRQQILAYLKHSPAGTRIAIFGLTRHLVLLQGFTSDPEVLKRAVAKKGRETSSLLSNPVGGGGVQNSAADELEDSGGSLETVANLRDFDAKMETYQQQLRATYTLDAMSQLARYLAAIPGRKNLIWFSGSFPVHILPDTSGMLTDPFATMASSEDQFRETVTMLTRSQVAVYPIDARGLFNSPKYDASTNRGDSAARGNQDSEKFFETTAAEQGTMYDLAEATGGHPFLNTNDLTQAVAAAIHEGANFYTLTYTPIDPKPDGKLRKINVEVVRQGLTLKYRRGYYADRPARGGRVSATASTTQPGSPEGGLELAMMRGAPAPSEIIMQVGVVPLQHAIQNQDQPAEGNHLVSSVHGPYRSYRVVYGIDPRDVGLLRTSDGTVRADIDLIVYVYTPAGDLINTFRGELNLQTSVEQMKQIAVRGIFRTVEINTPAKGEYFLRIAVHDRYLDHFGAVEVATSEVRNEAPKSATAGASASRGSRK